MTEIIAKLRWFPLGPAYGPLEPIKKEDLDSMAKQYGVSISLEEVVGKNRREVGGIIYEDTLGRTVEEISQTVVTVSTDDESAFRKAIRALVRKYRAPRSTYCSLGSNQRGQRLLVELFDEEDGWR